MFSVLSELIRPGNRTKAIFVKKIMIHTIHCLPIIVVTELLIDVPKTITATEKTEPRDMLYLL